jgi:hypothetical protein
MAAITVTPACPDATIAALGARDWPIWTCGVSRFPWTYDEQETCLLLEIWWCLPRVSPVSGR